MKRAVIEGIGHFDIYVGDAFEQAVADQCQFYRRHLTTTSRESLKADSNR